GASPQDGLIHFLGAGGVLDDRALGGEVALEDGDGAVSADGLVVGADDVLPGDVDAVPGVEFVQPLLAALVEAVPLQLVQVLAQGLAGDGHRIQVQVLFDLLHDGGHAAGVVEALGGPAAGGADVQQVPGTP